MKTINNNNLFQSMIHIINSYNMIFNYDTYNIIAFPSEQDAIDYCKQYSTKYLKYSYISVPLGKFNHQTKLIDLYLSSNNKPQPNTQNDLWNEFVNELDHNIKEKEKENKGSVSSMPTLKKYKKQKFISEFDQFFDEDDELIENKPNSHNPPRPELSEFDQFFPRPELSQLPHHTTPDDNSPLWNMFADEDNNSLSNKDKDKNKIKNMAKSAAENMKKYFSPKKTQKRDARGRFI